MIGLVPRKHWEHSFRDFLRGLYAALGPRKEQDKLIPIAELGNCIPVRSGRAGLVAAIKALKLKSGARIGVPLYCCSVVFEAIKVAGYIPYFLDIEPETFCLSPEDLLRKRSQIEAVIAVHMFGNLCDMIKLKAIAQDKPIIEDCAQALGSKIEGRMAGSFGTISFFSFRAGKYLSVGEGGALYSHDIDMRFRLSQQVADMYIPGRKEECIHVVKVHIKSILRSKPLYGVVGLHIWNILDKRMKLQEKSSVLLSQIKMTDFNLIRERLPSLVSIINKQRINAEYYSRTLKLETNMICSEKPGTFYNRYHFPILFPSTEHRDFISSYLYKRQIDSIKHLDNIVDIATAHYGYKGGCPIAEQHLKRALIIPSYYSLKQKDVRHIAQCINEGLVNCS